MGLNITDVKQPGLAFKIQRNIFFSPADSFRVSGGDIVDILRDREVACSTSEPQSTNFQFCVWRVVSSYHPLEVLLAQLSLHVHKGGLKRHSF